MPLCHYCALREAGSREHLPGVAALNDAPVMVRYLVPQDGKVHPVERRDPDGFVVRTICTPCNQRTGGSYGTAFKEFALQFRSSGVFDAGSRRTWITLTQIQPLRVLKQLAAMFLAAQVDLPLDHWEAVRQFVRRRDMKLPAGALRFYLYRNTSPFGRVSSMSGQAFLFQSPKWPPLVAAEVSWPPLGVVFTKEAHPHLAGMRDITEWGQYSFKERDSFGFTVPLYRVEANWPLAYGTLLEADRWTNEKGAVILFTASASGNEPAQIAALLKQERRPPS